MIGRIEGTLVSKEPEGVIVDTGGVGYLVEVPLSTFYGLGEKGQKVILLIHTYVREDAIILYGFATSGERSLFRRLISISGIGPRLALAIIGSMGPAELLNAIDQGDLAKITTTPGVGKKTAERLIVELRDKLTSLRSELGVQTPDQPLPGSSQLLADIVSALENLGYKSAAAERAARAAVESSAGEDSFEMVLKRALSSLTS